jgi:hypothetical protein
MGCWHKRRKIVVKGSILISEMKKHIYHIIIISFGFLLLSLNSSAQKKVNKKVFAQKIETSRGQNPNVKSDPPETDEPELASRGSSCTIRFANYTGYYVNIYVDGYYRGQVAPWGGGTVVVGSGYTSIYCITAGKTLEWKDAGDCKSVYTFKLYP